MPVQLTASAKNHLGDPIFSLTNHLTCYLLMTMLQHVCRFCTNLNGCGSGCSDYIKTTTKDFDASVPADLSKILPIARFGPFNECNGDKWPMGMCTLKAVDNPANPPVNPSGEHSVWIWVEMSAVVVTLIIGLAGRPSIYVVCRLIDLSVPFLQVHQMVGSAVWYPSQCSTPNAPRVSLKRIVPCASTRRTRQSVLNASRQSTSLALGMNVANVQANQHRNSWCVGYVWCVSGPHPCCIPFTLMVCVHQTFWACQPLIPGHVHSPELL